MNKSMKRLGLLIVLIVLAVMLFGMPKQSAQSTPALTQPQSESALTLEEAFVPGGSVQAEEPAGEAAQAEEPAAEEPALDEDGSYTSKEDVALYLITYGHLPSNFITKKEAQAAGWDGGRLDAVCPGKCIGGDYFGNYEHLLPSARGRTWTECDINTLGARSRGAERLVFSNDGLIYYTGDHYESFELLYGEP